MEFIGISIDVFLITSTLALAAFGLAIVYGLVGVINMGHGAMLTLGAYLTWYFISLNIPFFLCIIFSGIGVALVGITLEHFIIRKFYHRPFDTLLLTWAFFLITTEVIKIIFGTDFKNIEAPISGAFEVFGINIPAYRFLVCLFTIFLITISNIIFLKTNLGIKIRALIQNKEVAGLMGLDINLTYKAVFGFGSFMAGIAGGLIAPMLSIDPYIGNIYLVRSFFVVIVGGVGNLLSGTVVGSFLIGGTETLFAIFSDQVVSQASVFLLAIILLRLRPNGIMNKKDV
jgi:branched-subunit amino acid ABC-type transport system permease component